jgi:hypothetical protein
MTRSAIEKLLIPYVGDPLLQDNQALGSLLKKVGCVLSVDKINWPEYTYKPFVKLYSGYSGTYLYLFYEVEKDFFRAHALADQEPVWEDSCVEFFISRDDSLILDAVAGEPAVYRNFEFNALGYCLSAYGNKLQREPLASAEMERILRMPSLDRQNMPAEGAEFSWELSVAIPLDLLGIQPGSVFRANFYKCGDLTKKPHFLSWNRINSASPDFHLPQFFGEAELAPGNHNL